MALVFPHSVGYIGMIHGKKNISEKCSELGLFNKLIRDIKEDIFHQGGLIYARSSKAFDEQCRELKNKWHDLESAEKLSPSFVQYFEKHKEEDIKDHMRVMLSQDGGFGDQVVTSNPIESANAVIKRWNNFQPKNAAKLLEDMLACVQEQANNAQKAFLNLPSKYNVREEFQDKVIRSYNLLDTAAKKKALDSIKDIKIDSKCYSDVKPYKPVGLVTCLVASFDKSETNNVEISADDPFNCLMPSFTRSDVDLLKCKAEEIVERKQIITDFSDHHFIVKSGTAKYQSVKLLSTNKCSCDHDCLGYESRKICAHTIATALYCNNPHKYLETFQKESTINLTKLTIPSSVSQTADKKSGKQRKRKHKRSGINHSTYNSW